MHASESGKLKMSDTRRNRSYNFGICMYSDEAAKGLSLINIVSYEPIMFVILVKDLLKQV